MLQCTCRFSFQITFQGRGQTSEQDEASFERLRREPLGGVWGHAPPENFEI